MTLVSVKNTLWSIIALPSLSSLTMTSSGCQLYFPNPCRTSRCHVSDEIAESHVFELWEFVKHRFPAALVVWSYLPKLLCSAPYYGANDGYKKSVFTLFLVLSGMLIDTPGVNPVPVLVDVNDDAEVEAGVVVGIFVFGLVRIGMVIGISSTVRPDFLGSSSSSSRSMICLRLRPRLECLACSSSVSLSVLRL